jgi:hypothetical protein
MVIEQTVDIPASRRLVLDVPQEVPAGRVILTFTPADGGEAAARVKAAGEWVNPLRGRGKALGSKLTMERFMEMQREDIDIENELDERLWKRSK